MGQRLRSLKSDESGQVLPLLAFMMIALLAMLALVIDVGHAYLIHRELQASCDAAALAGATAIPYTVDKSGVQTIATNYSSVSGGYNAINGLNGVTMVSGYPMLKCLSSMQAQGISCVGYTPYNAVQVKQKATVNTYFGKLIGFPTITIAASATATKGGGPSRPYNIVLMLDTSLSMNFYDADCGATQMQCGLAGVQILLQHLDPCGTSQPTCVVTAGNAANSVARVSIFTFPQMTYPTVSYDSQCGSSTATATTYTFPAAGATSYTPGTSSSSTTYRVTDFQSDYRVSDTATSLYNSSLLTIAAGGAGGCSGMGAPANAGDYGTYYAATIYAAQAALTQAKAANPGSQNVLIILGDGDANAPHTNGPYTVMGSGATSNGKYPSWLGECGQAITAANAATAAGTTVYSVAYGSPSAGCTTDLGAGDFPNVQPCNEMAQLASHSWDFFSDYKQTGSASTCVAAQTEVALSDIFLQIAGDLTEARLISDGAA
ncbi:Flp pilus assembly protein TadG [Granulicella aggregans]|uniref:Flp pilus assembly protein TadG n=1 Tax=Granulicella aggregans TaxID=474949 RepID=A0A7W7ZGS4_9BACT|nr:Tad domain-containing protein [Granulicella aggregans]MBB5059573.1 Flp pilus assembly protein TadG [Granulicella aggregans]